MVLSEGQTRGFLSFSLVFMNMVVFTWCVVFLLPVFIISLHDISPHGIDLPITRWRCCLRVFSSWCLLDISPHGIDLLGGVRVLRRLAANFRDPPPLGVFDTFPKSDFCNFGSGI